MSANTAREAMAALAAQLMSGISAPRASTPTTTNSASNGTVPRSAPASQAAFSSQVTTSVVAAGEYVASKSNRDMPPPSRAPAQTPSPAPVSEGPSLRGNPEQLREAAQFLSSATAGKATRRGGSRGPVLSRGSRSSGASTPPSPAARVPVASAGLRPGSVPRTASEFRGLRAQPAPPSGLVTKMDMGPKIKREDPPAIKREDSVMGLSSTPKELPGRASLPKFELAPSPNLTAPSSPAPKKEENVKPAAAPILSGSTTASGAGSLQSRQMKEITNTLNGRASDVPPHLRRKADAKAEPTPSKPETASTPTIAASPQLPKVEAPAWDTVDTWKGEKVVEKVQTNGFPTASAATQASKPVATPTTASQQGKSAVAGPSDGLASGKAQQTVENAHTNGSSKLESVVAEHGRVIETLRKEVQMLAARVTAMEQEDHQAQKDYFQVLKELEPLKQAEERRKQLGTDGGAVPFGIDVQGPNGKLARVQGSPEMKVGDLIRRIRVKMDVQPADSRDPRVLFEGSQVGHGTTLGEAGIRKDSIVVFSYSV